MDQDDLEDEVFTKTIVAHIELLSTSSRQIFEWQRRYIQRELIYALAVILGCVLAIAKHKGKCTMSRLRISILCILPNT